MKISLELIINPELMQVLFSFGSDLKVLAPESLKQKMLDESRKMQAHYLPLMKEA